MHRLRESGVLDCLEFVANEFTVCWGQADGWTVSRFPKCFNNKWFYVLLPSNIVQNDGNSFDAIVQGLVVIGFVSGI